MVSPATMTKDNSPREYAALMARTTISNEQVSRDKRLQLTETFTQNTANANGISAILQANPTITNRFIVLQSSTIHAQVTLGTGIVFIAQGVSSSEEAAETHIRYGYNYFGLPVGNLGYAEVQFWHQSVVSPEGTWISTEVIQEKEEQEQIYADTNQTMTLKDLAGALDRISRPTEIEDIPLPFDPDDYPVV
jgi:hypothetical protein